MGVKISSMDPASSLTGAELIELSQGGASVRSTVDAVKNGGVKVYRALLSQSGTDAPIATVLENTLGGVPVLSRRGVGQYSLILAGVFTENKTLFTTGIDFWNGNAYFFWAGWVDVDTIDLESNNLTTNIDLGSGANSIQILVYP